MQAFYSLLAFWPISSQILDHFFSYAVIVRSDDTKVFLFVNPKRSADSIFLKCCVDILDPVDG